MATGGSTSSLELPKITCENLRHFKETLKSLRTYDDKIIYKLNVSVPTQSFKHEIDAELKCKTLYKDLLAIYKIRHDGIKDCIANKSNHIESLQKELELNKDDHLTERNLRTEQTSLRLIQSELMVEEVIKSRTLKVFEERCWMAYTKPTTA